MVSIYVETPTIDLILDLLRKNKDEWYSVLNLTEITNRSSSSVRRAAQNLVRRNYARKRFMADQSAIGFEFRYNDSANPQGK